jgi:hypothetical protein
MAISRRTLLQSLNVPFAAAVPQGYTHGTRLASSSATILVVISSWRLVRLAPDRARAASARCGGWLRQNSRPVAELSIRLGGDQAAAQLGVAARVPEVC